jgi:hypothetical protein
MHADVERLTVDSTLCTFCVVEGGREEGLLSGFYWGAFAASSRPIAICDAHRIRLSFYFELVERLKEPSRDEEKKP